jgi:hypothetical protein
MSLVFKVMLVLLVVSVQALKVAMLVDAPYTGQDSLASRIWGQAALEAGLTSSILEVQRESEGTACVLEGSCDAFISYGLYSDLVTSHPLLYVRFT